MAQTFPTGRRAILRKILIDLAFMGVIGVTLALIGPFGSFQDPLATRLIVWVGFAYIGYALYSPIDVLAQKIAPALALPVWALRVAGVLLSSIPMAIVVWLLPRLPDRARMPDASEALENYFYVAVIGGMITVLFTMGQRSVTEMDSPVSQDEPSTPTAPEPPRFLDRLPPEIGTELLALEMEDHYVRAHTSLGSELVLMRLGDAIAELKGVDGRQVHRSWWVARDAVEEVRREGRNLRLVLARGIEAPVSRNRAGELKAAGWL
ncbi:LytTR family transcriptional regulator DNA-binding domain-containing protein [Qipengyuania sp. 1NDW9]|uniref:LytTR family transcriptional regulator DNA-binding domain-containing protein n=1 Tax=Qipengyuania xiapuensis TaxID=2867236 RepID=A0ABX8ZXE7_9SPHN|nr:LytTR family DNA-binding domain-containing protein [Qipengyuania xiapuensis]MBX7492019.1 LytTR family transcriptional regulator DNA-binding domain-containing protein [Qipengyuania xiapuensis]QZD93695.1 LytTR family transcriptional regulator DNA-binding domain-containing protein [Qipengyuania xiapuensis]